MHYGKTDIIICEDELDLGERAAAAVSQTMRQLLEGQGEIRMILAAGESQIVFLDALARQAGIDWSRVVCFNMDDFWAPDIPAELTCGHQLRRQLYDKVRPKNFYLVQYNAPDAALEALRFESVLRSAGPIDTLCQGIGTSGHLAFNEPGQTNFQDSLWSEMLTLRSSRKDNWLEIRIFETLRAFPIRGLP